MESIRQAVDAVRWPPDSDRFTIFPQSGRRRGEGNGVKPIKEGFVAKLTDLGWTPQKSYPRASAGNAAELYPGAFDASLDLAADGFSPFVVEWETGNVSSSHRAINKIALALLRRRISGGILVVPTRDLYRYLTDRIGNYRELEPYFPLWEALPILDGYLGIVAVEHDDTSGSVPRISKGTDGRALI